MRKNNSKKVIKRVVKKSLIATKKIAAKSPHIRRAARLTKNVLFTNPYQNIYNVSRYSPTIAQYQKQLTSWEKFEEKPLISVVMPTYNSPIEYLRECIESVILQSYPKWELCIADDCSPDPQVVATIEEYCAQDSRIKLVKRDKNGHISAATNSAVDIAAGEFIALLDHDDVLWPNALYEMVAAINQSPDVDFLYTDEDKIDETGDHSYPFFKPDWSPEFLESCNYITHFACIRTTIMKQIGGFRVGFEGAQDWDLFLRIAHVTNRIVHIPKVLYSWRIHAASTAQDTDAKPYVYEAQHKLLVEHVNHGGNPAVVKQGIIKQHASIEYKVIGEPSVSIVVRNTKDNVLKRNISSLAGKNDYKSSSIVLIPASARQRAVCESFARKYPPVEVAPTSTGNEARDFNAAISQSDADYIICIQDNMIVSGDHWVELMLGDAQRDGVGVVGGKTLCSDKMKIERAGCGLGIYGLYASLLEGMPVEDIHYLRGLYGQSRRNTLALDSGSVMFKRDIWSQAGGFAEDLEDMFVVDFCLRAHNLGLRNVYNPFVNVIDVADRSAGDLDQARSESAKALFQKQWAAYIDYDPYFNPNFTRTNAQLEIK